MVKRVEHSLHVAAGVGVQGFGLLHGDHWFFQLLQPGPHESGQDEGVLLRTQSFPRSSMVQLSLGTRTQTGAALMEPEVLVFTDC